MERDEFLKSLGIGLALVCTGSCFTACSKGGGDDEATPGGNNNNNNSGTATVDISTLANVGSQKSVNGVLFIRIAAGSEASAFVATEAICPHEGGNLNWQSNKIECDNHHATFQSTGTVISQPIGGGTVRNLKIYATTLSGTSLTATKS